MRCTQCGSEVSANIRFCTKCGAEVINMSEYGKKQCFRCGSMIDADKTFCTFCGQNFSAGPESVKAEYPRPVPEKKSNTGLIIVIVLLAMVILAGIVGGGLWIYLNSTDDESSASYVESKNDDRYDEKNDSEIYESSHVNSPIEFRDFLGNVMIDRWGIKDARAKKATGAEGPYVELTFTESGREKFKKATETVMKYKDGNNYLEIYLDNSLISRPKVYDVIDSDTCIITGSFTDESAEEMASYIRNGVGKYEGVSLEKEKEEQMPPEEEIHQNVYLFPSDAAYITRSDLAGLSKEQVAFIRNEIYARHGYMFKSEPYKSYFEAQDWYVPNEYFDESEFSYIEKWNADFIVEYEKERGWR